MNSISEPTWHVILNPHAGCGKGFRDREKIISLLDKSGLAYQLHTSDYAGHTVELSRQLVEQGASHFILAGGDGTLNEAVNGVFRAKNSNAENVIFGMIPVGTGNDWTKTFGISVSYQEAINIIKEGKTVSQDVGEIAFSNSSNPHRYFVNIAGFGFDAIVAGRANKLKNEGISGIRVYIQSFLWSYMNFRAGHTIVNIDKEWMRVNMFSLSVGLGKFNGGGMMQVPDANPLKGLFHITIIRKMSIWGIIRNFKGLYDGSFVLDSRVSTHVGTSVSLRSIGALPGEADGESLGKSSFKINIIPHKLKVIYGSDKYLN